MPPKKARVFFRHLLITCPHSRFDLPSSSFHDVSSPALALYVCCYLLAEYQFIIKLLMDCVVTEGDFVFVKYLSQGI
jgi:hypothetical protein